MLLIKPFNNNGTKIDSSYEIFFDWAGNIYLESKKTNKIYQVLVDNTDNIILVQCSNPDFNKCDISFKKMKLSNDQSSLKGKIIKTINNEENDLYSESTNKLEHELFPENLDYIDDDDNDEKNSSDEEDYFEFSKINDDINIYSSDDTSAIYETFIYNGSYNSQNNLMFKTSYKGYSLPYRLLIFSSGEFIIKTVGLYQWFVQLSEMNDEPCLINPKKTSIKLSNN
jgi:hypothetical protein